MSTETWEKIKEILEAVLGLEPGERVEFLTGLDIDDEIRAEVESLLADEENSAEFMSLTVDKFSAGILGERDPSGGVHSGEKIGAYRIVREIGLGGMGAVFLAERDDGRFEQQVAVKMLRPEFNTANFREHFRYERRVHAALSHPNIATLLDAGATGDGIPYLVMEYVDGVPIDEYCKKKTLRSATALDYSSRSARRSRSRTATW
ncbi:MAG TPA: protein kinase [Pyrinomonadaceae bacterium]|nr:protein kinase [Pyrinomonadaceae bacterium]